MSETLSHRERLLRTFRYQPVDRLPDWGMGPWDQTLARWHREGMDVDPNDRSAVGKYFSTDQSEYGPGVPASVGLLPGFERTVLEKRGTHQIVQDEYGGTAEEVSPELGASIPHYLRFAIETRADWERVRDERLNPDSPGRVPADVDAMVSGLNGADYPVSLGQASLYGWIRNWMGLERLSIAIYEDRDWVEEMMEHLTTLTLSVLEKLAGKGLRVDVMVWWEDMCYNHGPLLSPRHFGELMVPRYQRITDFMRHEFGTDFHRLDCDGDIHLLAPLWLESGINVLYPLEAAHTDANRLAAENGRQLLLEGGFDKRAMAAGPAAIDAEFERLQPLLQRGGFIPGPDHMVPPDVSLENYLYYRRRKCEIIGKPWHDPRG